jgi:hypothetical protein
MHKSGPPFSNPSCRSIDAALESRWYVGEQMGETSLLEDTFSDRTTVFSLSSINLELDS